MGFTTSSQEETMRLAQQLLKENPQQKLWLLSGDLGSGKTSFVKGVAKHFGGNEKDVKSPTFALIQEHKSWIHADLYRLEQRDEMIEEELREYLKAGYNLFIEWPEHAPIWEDVQRAELHFSHEGQNKRDIRFNLLP